MDAPIQPVIVIPLNLEGREQASESVSLFFYRTYTRIVFL